MAVTHGKSGYFSLDNAAGSPIDLSAYVKEMSVEYEVNIHDTTTFGASYRSKTTGLKDVTITVTFVNDPTLQTHLTGLWGAESASRTYIAGPRGNTTGYQRFTGECLITGLPISANVEEIEMITVTFTGTGAQTIDTF